MTTQREIDREPKLVQAQESIDANVGEDDSPATMRANIFYQQNELELTDRQTAILLEWYLAIPRPRPRISPEGS